MVGVALTTEGECGLNMELQRTLPRLSPSAFARTPPLLRNESSVGQSKRSQRSASATHYIAPRRVKLTGDVANDDPRELQLYRCRTRLKCAHVTTKPVCDAEDVLVWSVTRYASDRKIKVWNSMANWAGKSLPDIRHLHNGQPGV